MARAPSYPSSTGSSVSLPSYATGLARTSVTVTSTIPCVCGSTTRRMKSPVRSPFRARLTTPRRRRRLDALVGHLAGPVRAPHIFDPGCLRRDLGMRRLLCGFCSRRDCRRDRRLAHPQRRPRRVLEDRRTASLLESRPRHRATRKIEMARRMHGHVDQRAPQQRSKRPGSLL